MTMQEWEALAVQTAEWIRQDEAAGDHEAAEAKRATIWQLYAQIDRTPGTQTPTPTQAPTWSRAL